MDLANNKWRIWLRRNGELHEETWWNMWMWLHISAFEPWWKPSVTPYVVSFWVRESFRHAYARRVFPYAKQIEETLTRSPYAALRKWGFCLRQTRFDKALTENVDWFEAKSTGNRALWTMKHGGLICSLCTIVGSMVYCWQSEHIGTKRRKDITNMATKNQG